MSVMVILKQYLYAVHLNTLSAAQTTYPWFTIVTRSRPEWNIDNEHKDIFWANLMFILLVPCMRSLSKLTKCSMFEFLIQTFKASPAWVLFNLFSPVFPASSDLQRSPLCACSLLSSSYLRIVNSHCRQLNQCCGVEASCHWNWIPCHHRAIQSNPIHISLRTFIWKQKSDCYNLEKIIGRVFVTAGTWLPNTQIHTDTRPHTQILSRYCVWGE
jgi:hypothetical protein